MKNIITYIKESTVDIDKYYKPISSFKDGDNIIAAWIDEDGYARPFNVIVKKKGNEVVFVNPDDDRDIMTWKDFANSTDDSFDKENPQIAVADTPKELQKFCDYFNDINDM